jgi:outer membrane biosynthesis protein TonB
MKLERKKGDGCMNDVEKKIKARSEARQASTTSKAKATKEDKAPKAKAEPKPKTSKAKAEPKPKTSKAKAEPKPKKDEAPNAAQTILTTKEVAAMVGTTPKALRRVLRAKWYNDGVMTHYAWTKDDPTLKKILEYYAQKKTGTNDKEKE